MFRIGVLGICASPRAGNSAFLLKYALEAAQKVDPENITITTFLFKGKKMGPCLSCLKCLGNGGNCIIKDDFQYLRGEWIKADVIIYSVPVYHMGVPGQIKCFIDRLGNSSIGYHNFKTPRRLKIIGAIAQGMDLFAGQEACQDFILKHAVLMNCIPVSGDGPESYIGAGGWTRLKWERDALEKFYTQGDEDAKLAVKASQSVGKRTVEVAMMIKAGLYFHREKFGQDPRYRPIVESLEHSLKKSERKRI